jgi:hypothetical protein
MTGDWRDWRPVIWMTMIGIAVMLLLTPFYFGAIFIGMAVGLAVKIGRTRRRRRLDRTVGGA